MGVYSFCTRKGLFEGHGEGGALVFLLPFLLRKTHLTRTSHIVTLEDFTVRRQRTVWKSVIRFCFTTHFFYVSTSGLWHVTTQTRMVADGLTASPWTSYVANSSGCLVVALSHGDIVFASLFH